MLYLFKQFLNIFTQLKAFKGMICVMLIYAALSLVLCVANKFHNKLISFSLYAVTKDEYCMKIFALATMALALYFYINSISKSHHDNFMNLRRERLIKTQRYPSHTFLRSLIDPVDAIRVNL